MLVASNIDELKKKFNTESILEDDTFYWVKTDKGYMKVLKPRSIDAVQEILRLGNFPERYIALLPSIRKTPAVEIALRSKKGLLLWGPAGVGKTTACVFKIARLLKEHRVNNPLYVPAFDLEYERINSLKQTADCFLIDDLNTKALHETRKGILIEVIYHAYNHNKKLFITSNEKRFDLPEPVISRIAEMCTVKRVEGEDLRIKA